MAFDPMMMKYMLPEQWGPGWGAPGMPVHPGGFPPMASPATPGLPGRDRRVPPAQRPGNYAGLSGSTAAPLPASQTGGGTAAAPMFASQQTQGQNPFANWLAAMYGGGGGGISQGGGNPWFDPSRLVGGQWDQWRRGGSGGNQLFNALPGGLNLLGF